MSLAIINFIPFMLALGLMVFGRFIPKIVRAWGALAILSLLFIALLSYFPELQSIDTAYKEQQGISLEENYGDSEASSETYEETAGESSETITINAITQDIEWVPELGLTLSFYLDGLSLIFSLIVTGIGAIIFFYAGYYFDDDAEQLHFLTIFFAFAGAMLGLVLSGNLITLFMMWEMTSITSFLLIGFKGAKSEDTRFGAMQALIITGLGGLALIAAFVLLASISGDVLFGTGFTFNIAEILQARPEAVAAHPLYLATLILLAIAAFTKSAQFPFHFWLPGAMAAPTPASAYLHSATMVKAGIYLLLRFYPPMHANELWTTILVTFGIGTMLIAAVIALFQRDLKGLLAYSTVSWLGALVGMIGLPNSYGIKAALVGIIAHALYKAALFLSAGTIDHSTGTRILDNLGGIRKQMPVLAIVVIISGLSMAGLPIFFGFVAKEVLLDAWIESHFIGQQFSYYVILISAALTGTAAFIFIWDVFFKAPTEEIHYHKSAWPLSYAPLILAIATTIFGLFLDPPLSFVEDFIATTVPKTINLHLLPDSFTNPIFLTSLTVVTSGFVVFLLRNIWLPTLSKIPIPRASHIYQGILNLIDWIGDQIVKTQNGQLRYYLIAILGIVSVTVLTTGIVADLSAGEPLQLRIGDFDSRTILQAILLLLTIVAAFYTVLARRHLNAALALGVVGYAVGGLFLIEPAPDVSLVQFLVETLATILIIIMLGRINDNQRWEVMEKLWQGRSVVKGFNLGIVRDVLISGAVGMAIFFFALTALVNRPERESITQYHLDNTYEDMGIQDVVGAIVANYRGLDTVIEVTVFSVAALGVLTLLTRGLAQVNPFAPNPKTVKIQDEFRKSVRSGLQDATNLNTPFTRMVSRLVLPLSFLVALSHIVNGGHAPGDGFTAGAIAGLVTALWFVVFGYKETKQRLSLFAPHRLIRAGLIIVILNAFLPIIFGLQGGIFLAHVNYGKIWGVNEFLHRFGLELTSGLFFEIGIALTIFGGIGVIMEAIAHPAETLDIDYDPRTTGEFRSVGD
jgi:NADH:ubiquinone oxidoreductase subunit 5 (subunit L)/multisubunit Na+/H+ antiporter MnhA subunit